MREWIFILGWLITSAAFIFLCEIGRRHPKERTEAPTTTGEDLGAGFNFIKAKLKGQ
jgi:hypothetical protein